MGDLSDRVTARNLLQNLDPYEFESVVADLWEKQGYETTVTSGSSDRGIDVIATKEAPVREKQLIQAKRYSDGNKVGSQEVRKYATLYQQEPDVDTVVVVTTSSFTDEALTLAGDLDVKAVSTSTLLEMLEETDYESLSGYFGSDVGGSGETHVGGKEETHVDADATRSPKAAVGGVGGSSNEEKSATTGTRTSSRKEYLRHKNSGTDQSTRDSAGRSGTQTTDRSSSEQITPDQVTSAIMWLLRLGVGGLAAFLALGALGFGLVSLVDFAIHPQFLPSLGFAVFFFTALGLFEHAYADVGLRLVPVRAVLLVSALLTAVGILDFIEPAFSPQDPTVGYLAFTLVLTLVVFAIDKAMRGDRADTASS